MVSHTSQRCARQARCRRGRPPRLPMPFEGLGCWGIRDRATRAATAANHTDRGTCIQVREPGNHGGLPLRVAGDGCGRPGFSLHAMTGVRAKPGAPNKANFRVRLCGVETRETPNKPNLRRFWPGNGVAMKNRANSEGQDCHAAALLAMTAVRVGPGASNKANFPARPCGVETREAPNKPNFQRFWPENGAVMKNRANSAARDCFPRLREGRLASLLAMTPADGDPVMRNEPNFGRFGPETRVAWENKANSAGQNCRVASLLATTAPGRDTRVSNEANSLGRCGLSHRQTHACRCHPGPGGRQETLSPGGSRE